MKAFDLGSAGLNGAPGEGRRERHRRETRARIVRAARMLFERKGFEATTTQEIARRADIGTGTLFNYAHTKEDLLLLIFHEEMIVVVKQAFATVPKRKPLLDQLLHFFDSMVAYHNRDVAIARVLIRQLASPNSPESRDYLRDLMRSLIGCMVTMIREAQRRGEIRQGVPRALLAQNLFSLYYRLLQTWLDEYITLKQYRSNIGPSLELQLRGLRCEASGRPRLTV